MIDIGIINGTFDTDLTGWQYSGNTYWPYCNNAWTSGVVWEGGSARLHSMKWGAAAWMSQKFLIANNTFSFDYNVSTVSQTRTDPSWSLTAHVPTTDPVTGETVIVNVPLVSNEKLVRNGSGVIYKDVSPYIGMEATISFTNGGISGNSGYCGNSDEPGQNVYLDNVINSPNWGTLRVSSVPGGANIYVDDSFLNIIPETGSIDLTNISPGSHTVKITKTDYFDYSATVNVFPGRIYLISATLNPQVGCLSILSDPTGAQIYLSDRNGQTLNDTGFTTFKQICNLFWGDYKWKLILPGYDPKSGIAHLTSAAGVSITETLTLTGIGCIYFETNTPGAKIIVDNADTGLVTPNKVCGLSLGTHTYELALTGYQTSKGTVVLTSTKGEVVSLDLTACTPNWQCEQGQTGYEIDGCGNRRENPACLLKGSIKFTSTPAGAEIFLDGADQGIKTPATLTDVPVGSHGYTLKLDGFNDSTGTVPVLENQIAEVSVSLVPLESCIYFATSIPGAKIFVDNVDTGKVTPSLVCGLTLGPHTYSLSLTGYQDITGSVDLVAGQGTTVTGTLPKKGIGTGTIIGLTLLGVGVLGAVVYASKEKKPEYTLLKYKGG